MISHSTSGLTVLPPERDVTVVEEEHHQAVLARYAPPEGAMPRRVVVELHHAPIARGTYAGRPGVEILLDGHRVGELTFRMAQHYGPIVAQTVRRGERPGARATVKHGGRGLVEMELRLPALGTLPPVPDIPEQRRGGPPVPPAPPAAPRTRRKLLIGAGAAGAVLVLFGIIGGHNGSTATTTTTAAASDTTTVAASAAPPAAPVPTTVAAAPVAPAPPVNSAPATTARTTTAPPAPSVEAAAPKPAVKPAPKPAPKPAAEPGPAAEPSPATSGTDCDPNYSGCVPIASDVDCAGGSGNGPAYVSGPVRVTGTDIYKLDADKDGIACE